MAYLFLACDDGHLIVRVTRSGKAFYAPEHMVRELRPEPIPARVYPIDHRLNVGRNLAHRFPRSRKG